MKVTMFWYGGSSYGCFDTTNPEDAEQFDSLAAAKRAFASRTSDSYYPCVDESEPDNGGPEAWIFLCPRSQAIGADCPDRTMRFGPRGGVVISNA